MASVWKHPKSRYWTACFTDGNGKRRKQSTKETNRRKAAELAHKLEETYRTRISEATARRLITEACSRQLGKRVVTSTTREFAVRFLARKEIETSYTTWCRYSDVITKFLDHLGDKADDEIQFVSQADLEAFRDSEFQRLSPASANLTVKIVRMFFRSAHEGQLIDGNPAAPLKPIKKDRGRIRRPFSLPEIRKLLAVADTEWKGIILFGLYTGQRLGDIVGLTWANIDLENRGVDFATRKTGRTVLLPLAQALIDYLLTIPTPELPTAPVFPNASSVLERKRRVGALSSMFYELMVAAGLSPKRVHSKSKQGRDGRRVTNELSFHSLRHTATSLLKNAGVSDVVARDMIGHESAAISASYTHVDMESKRAALERLPSIS